MFAKLLVKLKKKYRIAFIDNESLTVAKLLVVRPLVAYVFLGLVVVMLITSTASLIVFTPFIRKFIPGYTNPELEAKFEEQQIFIANLEKSVAQQDSFIQAMQRIYENGGSLPTHAGSVYDDNSPPNYEVANADIRPENIETPAMANRESPGSFQGTRRIAGVLNLMPPVKGIVTEQFNPEEKHFGIDLVANENAIIKSIADGFVIFSEYSTQTGYVIGIMHGNNLISFYKHNSRVYKKVGSYVFSGEAIAVIGNSGENSTGPHLHFELWDNGVPRDPHDYMILN